MPLFDPVRMRSCEDLSVVQHLTDGNGHVFLTDSPHRLMYPNIRTTVPSRRTWIR